MLHEEESMSLRNIVYMGMGEPMLNYDNVAESIRVATTQKKLDLSNRRVTVSTCGIIPGIDRFTKDFPQTSLAVSLHSPNDDVRKSIMPVDHQLLQWKLAHVNFIPYNAWEGTNSDGFTTTPKIIIDKFQKVLLDK